MRRKAINGGEAVVETLQAHDVDIIFGIPGGHSLPIYEALARQNKIRHVLGRHEQGLGYMADGYARASGRIGVITCTSGPAVANLACAMGSATADTSPILAIASTIRTDLLGKNRGGLHDCGDALDIMRPVCRHVRRCMSVEEVSTTLAELIHLLRTGRPGGVFCDIPSDILSVEAEVEIPAPLTVGRLQPDPVAISRAAELLVTAQRPVIIAGTGVVISGAGEELRELAYRLGALLVPTALGRGIIPGDDPHVITNDGVIVTEVCDVFAEADVVLAIGTMFKQEDTADWLLCLDEKLIHIDIDPDEIGRSYKPHLDIVADAREALTALLKALPDRLPSDGSWLARGKEAEKQRLSQRRQKASVEMQTLDILRALLPRDGIAVCDRCSLGYWVHRCMPAYAPRSFQYPMGYGGLGGALPQAFGAKLACPDRTVVCIIGDGGLQFTATELAVAVQENIPVTIVLCNNHAYGAIRAGQDRNPGYSRFGCTLKNPDFLKLAAAYGIPAVRADSLETFKQGLSQGIESNQLNLIELTVELRDPTAV